MDISAVNEDFIKSTAHDYAVCRNVVVDILFDCVDLNEMYEMLEDHISKRRNEEGY